ncbi:methyltransferase domain-containing protein [Erythrobacter litoralis]|uniref:CheR family methyltransferase n=1 Tax=Erythrobacter litoralis TaxID=39960 RepID=UPI002435CD6B|nr:CheR family methyltransferase [Erythrobacter litoralis]MDG6077849.1 methyltransferase domain-containing protein [Erythrobacter litoralis]
MTEDDASHRIIADLLAARTGQQLTESRRWRVSTALSGLFRELGIENVDQLACLLERPGDFQLATRVVEALLNHETYFFRDHAYFDVLEKSVIPELADRRSEDRRLRIWSAGCSTGQEVLSLAMIFAQDTARWADWDIQILGTDISAKAIAAAQRARYSQFEIQRGIAVTQMITFFAEDGGGWQATDSIRKFARYAQHSVLDYPPMPSDFDLVLCRNVLLYFDTTTRRMAFDRLASAVRNDGLLMLGAGETVIGQTDRFEPAECGSGLYRPTTLAPRTALRVA